MSKSNRILETIASLALIASPVALSTARAQAADPGAGAAPATAPHVRVNGEEISDLEHSPVIHGGSMLIPLNGILDRMAATVAWQPLIKRIDVQRGATHLQFEVGSARALVNGKPQEMDVAPELDGDVIMVPLRFTADSLGLYSAWDPSSRTISLSTTPPPHAGSHPSPAVSTPAASTPPVSAPPVSAPPVSTPAVSSPAPRAPGSDTSLPPELPASVTGGSVPSTASTGGAAVEIPVPVSGPGSSTPSGGVPALPAVGDTVSAALGKVSKSDGTPSLHLQSGADFKLGDHAIILSSSGSGRTREVLSVDDLKPGDQLVLHLDSQRQVSLVEVTYKMVAGSVQAVAGDEMLLTTGQVYHAAPDADVILATGKPGKVADLTPGTAVTMRVDPASGQVSRVEAGGAISAPLPGAPTQPVSVWVQNPGPYRAGDVLVATMHADPGASAAFSVPGLKKPIPMKEYEPGEYKGAAVIPAGMSLKDATVIGEIARPGQPASVVPTTTTITIDSAPPIVEQMSPAPGAVESNHQAAIYAVLDDRDGTGVDPTSVHMVLNGQDITQKSQVSERFVSATGMSLVDGINHVSVSARDRAGNYTLKHWDFTVSSLQNAIHKVGFTTSGARAGRRIAVTIEGLAGGEASFDVGANWLSQPMHEVRPGHYEGVLMLERGDRVIDSPVTGHLRVGDHVFSMVSTDSLTYVEGRPAAPTIETPAPGSAIEAPVVVGGHADPGVRVHVRVEYDNKVLSYLGLRGFSSDQIVDVDDTGAWRTTPMSLESLTPRAKHLVYRITCEALSPSGETSKKVQVTTYRDTP